MSTDARASNKTILLFFKKRLSRHICNYGFIDISYIISVYNYIHIKFHMASSRDSLVIANEPKAKCFDTSTHFTSVTQESVRS
jgi:hypothetical protein